MDDAPLLLRPLAAAKLAFAAQTAVATAGTSAFAVAALGTAPAAWWLVPLVAAGVALFHYVNEVRGAVPVGALDRPPARARVAPAALMRSAVGAAVLTLVLLAMAVAADLLVGSGAPLIVPGAILGFGLADLVGGLRVLAWQRRRGGTVLEVVGPVPSGTPERYAAAA